MTEVFSEASNEAHMIEFNPNPTQKQFIESRADADLFSSRMGEGKSAALVWSAFYHTRHNPGAIWYLIRDTWENLRATTLQEFFKWFPPGMMGTWHATHKEFTWASGVAQGTVGFLGMDSPDDASRLMSRPLAGFGMDEPAPASGNAGIDEMIFDMALSRRRQEGMNWYVAKLAENNPDEAHWTYRRFVSPGTPGYMIHQPGRPENLAHLPADYYAGLRKTFAHRPDLVRRFVEGEFGFQQQGRPVTPQWNDRMHLALGLVPVPRVQLELLWDFGHNPTCIVTQVTPMGHWLILDSIVGDKIGTEELIMDAVRPLLTTKYGIRIGKSSFPIRHIGDPSGKTGDQSTIHRSPVLLIRRELGGSWRSGPVKPEDRIEPLRAVLTRTQGGHAIVQVDRENAKEVWHALRGGYHYAISRQGIVAGNVLKNEHSHPGDAMSYGAAILFPMGRIIKRGGIILPKPSSYFGHVPTEMRIGKGPVQPGQQRPKHGDPLPK